MKDRPVSREKQKLLYKMDQRTRTGDDERAMRPWASCKKRLNGKLGRKADAVIKNALKSGKAESQVRGEDRTTNELTGKGLTGENNSRKWGVRALGGHLQQKQGLIRLSPIEQRRIAEGKIKPVEKFKWRSPLFVVPERLREIQTK